MSILQFYNSGINPGLDGFKNSGAQTIYSNLASTFGAVNFVRIRCTLTGYLPIYMYVLHTIQGTWLPIYVVNKELTFRFPS